MSPIRLRLKLLRERRGWSQAELSRRSRVAQATISRMEAGRRAVDLGNLEKLAKALGVNPRTLIG